MDTFFRKLRVPPYCLARGTPQPSPAWGHPTALDHTTRPACRVPNLWPHHHQPRSPSSNGASRQLALDSAQAVLPLVSWGDPPMKPGDSSTVGLSRTVRILPPWCRHRRPPAQPDKQAAGPMPSSHLGPPLRITERAQLQPEDREEEEEVVEEKEGEVMGEEVMKEEVLEFKEEREEEEEVAVVGEKVLEEKEEVVMEKDSDYNNDKKWCQEETKWQDHQDGDAPSPRLVVPPWTVETKGDLTTLGHSPRPQEGKLLPKDRNNTCEMAHLSPLMSDSQDTPNSQLEQPQSNTPVAPAPAPGCSPLQKCQN
ncbi:hypothetical protein H920_01252 [Fukomys damarensis]|uniref:Uncharacterized protein n=1 Tax=Fukomys damarensis TaxID=885580 RepID=A0A091E1Y4_FUKDA|nr:hypothetical protein H920_01252 [Fukomys damarensis]